MKILDDILSNLKPDAEVEEVMRGLHWTAVVSRSFGMASTVLNEGCLEHDHSDKNGPIGFLSDMTALELAEFCYSTDTSEASLGLAAINSLIEIDPKKCSDIDGLKHIFDMAKDKNISVIGHFPYLENLAKSAKNLWIIEKRPKPGDLPEESSKDYLPQSDIVIITSTALINHTIEGILGLKQALIL